VIAPGGARNILRDDPLRRWPIESYRTLCAELVACGYDVVIIGDQNDARFRAEFNNVGVTDRMGVSLTETLCILRDADVLVTHDTGPLHLARLVRTAVVAIFGPTDPHHVVGAADDVDVLWGGAHLACRPCYDGRNYADCSNNLCMKSVSVDAVVRAVGDRLARRRTTATALQPT
jgi:heptosyltransferase-2